jgi:hypothetical protein
MNRYGTFFNASWPIQKSRILWTQTNEKACIFLTDVKKIVFSNFPRNFQSFYFLSCLKVERGSYTLETKEAKYYGTYVVSTFTRFITYWTYVEKEW